MTTYKKVLGKCELNLVVKIIGEIDVKVLYKNQGYVLSIVVLEGSRV